VSYGQALFFNCHTNSQNNAVHFGNKLFPFSGETVNPKTQLTKIKHTNQRNSQAKSKTIQLNIQILNAPDLTIF
jgi:hypothetical protein